MAGEIHQLGKVSTSNTHLGVPSFAQILSGYKRQIDKAAPKIQPNQKSTFTFLFFIIDALVKSHVQLICLIIFVPIFVANIAVSHDGCSLLIIKVVIRKIRIDFNIRHRDMEEVHVYPATHIKPDLHK